MGQFLLDHEMRKDNLAIQDVIEYDGKYLTGVLLSNLSAAGQPKPDVLLLMAIDSCYSCKDFT